MINEVSDQIPQTDFRQSTGSIHLGLASEVFHRYIGERNIVY